jgi:hypothetical protein
MPQRHSEPTARRAILAIAGCRIAIGVGVLAAPRPALKALGFSEPGPQALALARVAGSRDLALGALTVAARDDLHRLRGAGLAAIAVDSADAVTFALASRLPGFGLVGAGNALAGASAALLGGWARRRL